MQSSIYQYLLIVSILISQISVGTSCKCTECFCTAQIADQQSESAPVGHDSCCCKTTLAKTSAQQGCCAGPAKCTTKSIATDSMKLDCCCGQLKPKSTVQAPNEGYSRTTINWAAIPVFHSMELFRSAVMVQTLPPQSNRHSKSWQSLACVWRL